MRKVFLKISLAVLLVCASIPSFSQVVRAAGPTKDVWPLSVGIAYSNYNPDWSGRLSGTTAWADWNFYNFRPLWDGLGLEVEFRDLNYGRTGADPKLSQRTISGGVIYTTHFYRRFHPYGKFLVGYGSTNFTTIDPNYSHDSRTTYHAGGGVDTRFYKSLWLRVNYERQFWPDFFNHHTMTPGGVDIGVAYDFKAFR